MTSALHYLDLTELSRRIDAREISPVEATTAQLTRIEALDGGLKSYAYRMDEAALIQARAAETEIMRGEIRGPLHGVPIAVKDLCWTRGVPTAAGMTIYRDFRPTGDATVVRKLYAAGAIILGKLQMTEGAYQPSPAGPGAGESVECGALARRVVERVGRGDRGRALLRLARPTDTGGSIRFPSGANGITGLKPSWRWVSCYGAFALAPTLDHIRPMARSAADCGAMLGAGTGNDPNDPTALQDPAPNCPAGMTRGSAVCTSASIAPGTPTASTRHGQRGECRAGGRAQSWRRYSGSEFPPIPARP